MNLKLFFVRASTARTFVAKTIEEGTPEGKEREQYICIIYIPPILKDVNRKNNFCLLPESKLFARLIRVQMLFFFNSSNEHRLTENYAEGILIASLMPIHWYELGFFVVILCSILE